MIQTKGIMIGFYQMDITTELLYSIVDTIRMFKKCK